MENYIMKKLIVLIILSICSVSMAGSWYGYKQKVDVLEVNTDEKYIGFVIHGGVDVWAKYYYSEPELTANAASVIAILKESMSSTNLSVMIYYEVVNNEFRFTRIKLVP
jgi:hypothetical protein